MKIRTRPPGKPAHVKSVCRIGALYLPCEAAMYATKCAEVVAVPDVLNADRFAFLDTGRG